MKIIFEGETIEELKSQAVTFLSSLNNNKTSGRIEEAKITQAPDKKPEEEPKAEAPKAEKAEAPEEKEITLDDCKEIAAKIIKTDPEQKDKVKGLITDQGADRVSELKGDQINAFYKEAKKIADEVL
ncbi:hypothetical protein QP246_02310 [Aerococcus urinae]|uniref:hypothetical protein n=1 Tax=Aerococcus urinae TaxID=1376 RepID=UPI00254F89CE|nr:hypothetical protein [Aerococcus urinae]MDK6688292.1 hypothetical protein [Aerococcus urinae]